MEITASIPSPPINGFHAGPLFFHFYGLCYVVGITAAIILTRRPWRAKGGNPDLVYAVAAQRQPRLTVRSTARMNVDKART